MSESIIPLSNFADLHEEVKGVEIESRLPLPDYVPAEDIEVNVGRIATMANIGRLKAVKIGLFSESQATSFSVSSVNSEGAAIASAAKTGAVARAKSSVGRNSNPIKNGWPRGESWIRINTEHPDLDDTSLREVKPWATLLDKGVRDGLKNAGRKQLLEPKFERRIAFGVAGVMDSLVIGSITLIVGSLDVIPILITFRAAEDMTGTGEYWASRMGIIRGISKDNERTSIRHIPVDRYFALKAIASTQKVISAKAASKSR